MTPYQEHEIQKATDCWLCQECFLAVPPSTFEKQDPKVLDSVSQKWKIKLETSGSLGPWDKDGPSCGDFLPEEGELVNARDQEHSTTCHMGSTYQSGNPNVILS